MNQYRERKGGAGMGRRRQAARRMERAMDLPGGTLCKPAILEIEGDGRAVIAGCRGIMTYSDDCICLRTPDGAVAFYGNDLEMGCLTADGATLTGDFQRIEFLRG